MFYFALNTAQPQRILFASLERIRRAAFSEIFQRHTWDHVLADSYLPLYESLAAEGPWTRK